MGHSLEIEELSHRYGDRQALCDLTLSLPDGCCFGMLGPNGSGKTTLFRILATLMPPQTGRVTVLGHDVRTAASALRRDMGVVFQAPSLDPHLTVGENLRHHGQLYGMRGEALSGRAEELLAWLSISDRKHELVRTLSGGMQRRVELARCLLHRPRLLLLDEPTTGLDPTARLEFWSLLAEVRRRDKLAVLYTTHWFEEAERADLLGILHQGHLAPVDTPAGHKAHIEGAVIKVVTQHRERVKARLHGHFGLTVTEGEQALVVENTEGPSLVARLITDLEGDVESISSGKPTLEDVFLRYTGHSFLAAGAELANRPVAKSGTGKGTGKGDGSGSASAPTREEALPGSAPPKSAPPKVDPKGVKK